MWKEVTRGKGTDFFKLRDYEGQLAEGQRGRVDLDLRIAMPDTIQRILQSRLEQAGVEEASVSGGKVLHITARKGALFLGIIVVAVLALAILIISWRFFKEVAEVIPKGVIVGGAVVLIILGVLLAVWFARGQVAAVT